MFDIKILTIRDMLPINRVDYASRNPVSLRITGTDLDQTSKVFVNDIECPEFIVESSGQVIAQVPKSEVASVITSVSAVANKAAMNRRSLLHFELLSSFKLFAGLEKLVQIFCRILFQTPGSDRFKPLEGGGLFQIIGRSVSRSDTKTLQAAVIGAVGRTRDQILSRQSTKTRMPPDERLLSATVEAVGFDPSQTLLVCRVSLLAVSGRQALANLLL